MKSKTSLPRRAVWSLGWFAVLLSVWTPQASAQMMLIDDFNDGNDDGWARFNANAGQPWGPGIVEVNGKDEYWLASSRPIPKDESGLVGSLWDGAVADPLYSDGTYRARLRIEEWSTYAGITMRMTGSLETGLDGYSFEVRPGRRGGTYGIAAIEDTLAFDGVSVDLPTPLNEDVFLEASAVGDQLSLKVWPANEPEPAEPQLAWTDDTYQTGTLGVFALREGGQGGGFLFDTDFSVTFDDLTFTPASSSATTVPEPSSGLLVASLCAILVVSCRQCWKYRACCYVPLLVFGLPVTGLLQQARAQVVFDLGTFIVPSGDPNAATKSLAIPAGKYNAYSLTTDWSEAGVDPWSEEAIWAISDGPLYEANTTMFVDPGSAPNSQRNNNPITLEWNGLLDLPLTGPFDASLLMVQAYDEPEGSFAARWANTVLELSYVTPPAPPDLTADLGVVATPFAPFVIDTLASDFDTDLGIYSETGTIVMQNDDAGGVVQSEVDLYNGLPAGDYIAAIGGFNTIFDDVYEVIPGDAGGDYGLNVAGHQFEGTLAASEVAYVGFSISDVASAGDFDKDGDVDGDDFLAWQGGFGTASGALKSDGDYDNDGDVDGDDFLGWQTEFGSGSGSASAAVPEPASLVLLWIGVAVVLGARRRSRRSLSP